MLLSTTPWRKSRRHARTILPWLLENLVGFDYSRMDPVELEIIMSEHMKSQKADKLDFPEVDSDGDVRPTLRDSSRNEAEKQSEEKFVKRVKRRTLRRRIRMERRRE